MKVTGTSITPPPEAQVAGRPALTPELLAAVGAKYSRSNEGLDKILASLGERDPGKMVDRIFENLDYGHRSIADMVPVGMFFDGISILMAYLLWAAIPVQTAAGQESSTRYIRMSAEGVLDPKLLGIPDELIEPWRAQNAQCFAAYEEALGHWESLLSLSPQLARIPAADLHDPSKEKAVARMKRNYAFDRARVFLPVGAATGMFLLMSARSWAELCQYLLSHPLREAQTLGNLVVNELALFSPHLMKYAVMSGDTANGILREFEQARAMVLSEGELNEAEPTPGLQIMLPRGVTGKDLAEALAYHSHRYAWIGQELRRTNVRYWWEAVGLAEIRDLNRHRPGEKYCPLVPQGFHSALDQCPGDSLTYSPLEALREVGIGATVAANERLRVGDPTYVYHCCLGTQFPFEHNTTGNKAVYTAELRTGKGAHYRYGRHFHDMLGLWFEQIPETRGLIIEGTAEPE